LKQKTTIDNFVAPLIEDVSSRVTANAKGDKTIWTVIVLLAIAGCLVVYSSSSSLAMRHQTSTFTYLVKQMMYIGIGLFIVFSLHKINYNFYARIAKVLYWASILLLVYTMFFGTQLNEGVRWIKVPIIGLTFQSSDVARVALFIYMSLILSKRQNQIKEFKHGFLYVFAHVALVCALVAPSNLSNAALLFLTAFVVLFFARVNKTYLLGVALLGIVIGGLACGIANAYYDKTTRKQKDLPAIFEISRIPTWIGRIQTFMFGEADIHSSKVYQINQAKIAMAKGGFFGKGPGQSEQNKFLPHCYSDFIFAIIVEEYGMFGAFIVLALYTTLFIRCIKIFKRSPYAFGALLAVALGFMLVVQAFAHAAVAVNLVPNTGVTLPLISMGGSSIMFTCVALGIILSVARNVQNLESQPVNKEVNNG
jgi:cell division protein FtsW